MLFQYWNALYGINHFSINYTLDIGCIICGLYDIAVSGVTVKQPILIEWRFERSKYSDAFI